MPLPPPPTKPVEPIIKTPGDIKKGAKLDILDIQAILAGGYPGDLWEGTDIDTVAMAAVPDGKHRCIILANAFDADDVVSRDLRLRISRLGVQYTIARSEQPYIDTIGVDAVVYLSIATSISTRGILLKPGDILSVVDNLATGSNVTLTVLYVDVYL